MRKTHIVLIVCLACVFLFFMFLLGLFSVVFLGESLDTGNVAVIPIKGVITTGETGVFGVQTASSGAIVEMLQKAKDSPTIEAVVLEIDSPGGSPVASDEIGTAVKNLGKPSVAWIREVGASGGYWIASNCDVIVANKMSITGSIGVISSYLEFAGLLNDYNVTYRRLVSGDYKDMGTPFRELKSEEQHIIEQKLKIIRDMFVQEVATNRDMSLAEVDILANGIYYLGVEAKENNLIDMLGGKPEITEFLESELDTEIDYVTFRRQSSFLESLAGIRTKSDFYSKELQMVDENPYPSFS